MALALSALRDRVPHPEDDHVSRLRRAETASHVERLNMDHNAAFARLSSFLAGHRSRSVTIDHPDRYGTGCWTVVLTHEHGVTRAQEASFWTKAEGDGGWAAAVAEAEGHGVVFATLEEDADWPGLPATLGAALDAVERKVWRPKEPLGPLPGERGAPGGLP